MALLTEKHKDRLIGGVITVLLLALGLWVKSCFNKDEYLPIQNTGSNSTTNQLKDSAKQENQTINQHIDTASTVNNDFSRNKHVTTNNNYFKQQESRKKDTAIINNGFLNQGGTGNTYNQTINPKPAPRHLNEQDKQYFMHIPRYMDVDVTYKSDCHECRNYASEIVDYLKSVGYNASSIDFIMLALSPAPKGDERYINVSSEGNKFELAIFPLDE